MARQCLPFKFQTSNILKDHRSNTNINTFLNMAHQPGVPQQQVPQQQLKIKPITSNHGKHLIPWRNKEFKEKLEVAIMKVCYLHKIHLKDKDKRNNETRWRVTRDEVFRQPEFSGYDGSWLTLYDKYRSILAEYAKKNGWRDENGGKTGNLSGEEGDPNDPNAKMVMVWP